MKSILLISLLFCVSSYAKSKDKQIREPSSALEAHHVAKAGNRTSIYRFIDDVDGVKFVCWFAQNSKNTARPGGVSCQRLEE